MVEAVNCLDSDSLKKLSPWVKPGATIAVIGSSGVGKSTLTNSLLGTDLLLTAGMREIQLTDCKEGIASTFADIEALALECRFADCQHFSEPGCAIQSAIKNGELDARRVENYHKLLKEETLNSASLAERRASDKALGKFYKKTLGQAKVLKGR